MKAHQHDHTYSANAEEQKMRSILSALRIGEPRWKYEPSDTSLLWQEKKT